MTREMTSNLPLFTAPGLRLGLYYLGSVISSVMTTDGSKAWFQHLSFNNVGRLSRSHHDAGASTIALSASDNVLL